MTGGKTSCPKCAGELRSVPEQFAGVPFCPRCSSLSDTKIAATGLRRGALAKGRRSLRENPLFSSSFGLLVVLTVLTVLVFHWRYSALDQRLHEQIVLPAQRMLERIAALPDSVDGALDSFVAAGVDDETRRVILSSVMTLRSCEWNGNKRPSVINPGELHPVIVKWFALYKCVNVI